MNPNPYPLFVGNLDFAPFPAMPTFPEGQQPRTFHSFWTYPLLHGNHPPDHIRKRLKSTLLFTGIGVVALKKLGVRIVLHADALGAEIFSCLPYDEIHTTLAGFDFSRTSWVSGKMLAFPHEPLGSCHLDLDVWLKSPVVRDIIFNSTADVVAQSPEGMPGEYDKLRYRMFDMVGDTSFIDMKKADNPRAYNCGVVRINRQAAKDAYLRMYWRLVEEVQKTNQRAFENNYHIPNLIGEQWLLYQMCNEHNFSVDTFCKGIGCPIPGEIGYAHLLLGQKYEIDAKLTAILRNLSPETLEKIERKFP